MWRHELSCVQVFIKKAERNGEGESLPNFLFPLSKGSHLLYD